MKIVMRVSLILTSIVLLTACDTFNSTEKSESLSEMEPFRLADYIDIPRLNETYYDSLPDQDIDVKVAYVLHVNTKDTLYKENSDESSSVASMSTSMSGHIIVQAIDNGNIAWDDKVKITDYAYEISPKTGFSSVELKQDKKYTVT